VPSGIIYVAGKENKEKVGLSTYHDLCIMIFQTASIAYNKALDSYVFEICCSMATFSFYNVISPLRYELVPQSKNLK